LFRRSSTTGIYSLSSCNCFAPHYHSKLGSTSDRTKLVKDAFYPQKIMILCNGY
jgi:hypothetical protein